MLPLPAITINSVLVGALLYIVLIDVSTDVRHAYTENDVDMLYSLCLCVCVCV